LLAREEQAADLAMRGWIPERQAQGERAGTLGRALAGVGAGMGGGPVGMATGLANMGTQVAQEAPNQPRPQVSMGGERFEYDTDRDPAVLRERLQQAVEESKQRAIFPRLPENVRGQLGNEPIPGVDYEPILRQSVVAPAVREQTPSVIRVGGREFPDTPEGQQDAIRWDRELNPPRASGGGGTAKKPDDPVRENINFLQDVAAEAIATANGNPATAMNAILTGPYRRYTLNPDGTPNGDARLQLRSALQAAAARWQRSSAAADVWADLPDALRQR
jgi:hypothetical protein